MNDKLKFYRSTLVQITKGLIGYTPMHKLAEDAGKITEEIMKKVDEYEIAMEQHFTLDKERVNYYTNNTMWTGTASVPSFIGATTKVNPDYLKTEPIRTIIDHGPQYQTNQKPYGTLGEHWKELMELFRIKTCLLGEWKNQFKIAINNLKEGRQAVDRLPSKLDDIAKNLGIEFIEDFVKACEKCEE